MHDLHMTLEHLFDRLLQSTLHQWQNLNKQFYMTLDPLFDRILQSTLHQWHNLNKHFFRCSSMSAPRVASKLIASIPEAQYMSQPSEQLIRLGRQHRII